MRLTLTLYLLLSGSWMAERLAQKALEPRETPILVLAPPATNPPPKTVTVGWTFPTVRFEIWQSEDLATWSLYTNAPCDVAFRVPADKPQQFFKVRAIDPQTGAVSDWAK